MAQDPRVPADVAQNQIFNEQVPEQVDVITTPLDLDEEQRLEVTRLVDEPFEDIGPDNLPNSPTVELETAVIDVTPSVQADDVQVADTSSSNYVQPTQPLPNTLLQYPSYTYSLSLHLLTAEEYNQIVENQSYTPTRVLIASAGRRDAQTFPRNEFFSEDFYFEKLDMTTVIGLSERTRGTNAIDVSFEIVEPYGLTFMNRLLDVTSSLGSKNYLDMPYVLEIDFFAMDDSGNIKGKIPGITKRIPIKIAHIDVEAGTNGGVYKFRAIPFSHSAYDLHTISTPAHFELAAKNISQFFGLDKDGITPKTFNSQRETEAGKLWGLNDTQVVVNGQAVNKRDLPTINFSAESLSKLNRVSAFADALNNWFASLRDSNKIAVADEYGFEFDPEIANSDFVQPESTNKKQTVMNSLDDAITAKRANVNDAPVNAYDPSLQIFSINAGTSIEKIISYLVRHTTYITKQLKVPEGKSIEQYTKELEENSNKELNWYKIVPKIKILDFDSRRGIFARKITYMVQKYRMTNVQSAEAPHKTDQNPIKKYNYIFTGENQDVLDWNLRFNALYYTAVTAFKDNLVTTTRNSQEIGGRTNNPDSYTGKGVTTDPDDPTKQYTLPDNSVMPLINKPVVIDTRSRATGGSFTTEEVTASDFEESLLSQSQGDQLQVDLEILGDPSFIKQDDVFYTPTDLTGKLEEKSINPGDVRLTPNGSIRTDNRQINVQLTFRTPEDIDESTGLNKFNSKYSVSVFSGLYHVLQVKNSFTGGQFTQVLTLARAVRQSKFDYSNNKAQSLSDIGNRVPGQDAITSPENIAPDLDQINKVVDDPLLPNPNAVPGVAAVTEQFDQGVDFSDLKNIRDTAETLGVDDQTFAVTTAQQQAQSLLNRGGN